MKRAFLVLGLAALWCYFRGHKAAARVPVGGDPRSALWGHRCPACLRAVDPDFVDPNRRTGPRAGQDQRFRRGA